MGRFPASAVSSAGGASLPSAIKFPNLHLALANVINGVSDAKLCLIGDSVAMGTGVSARIGSGYCPGIVATLREGGFAASVGLAVPQPLGSTADPRTALGTGWTLVTQGTNAGSWAGSNVTWQAANSAAGSFVFTPNTGDTYDSYDIYFVSNTGGAIGSATASLPGATSQTLNGNGGVGIHKVTIGPGTASANAVLTIGSVTTGFVIGSQIVGVEPFLSTTRRIRVGCAAVGSETTTSWTTAQAGLNGPLDCIKAYAANAWLLALGWDDAILGPVPPSTVFANYSTLKTAMQTTAADVIGQSENPLFNGFLANGIQLSYFENLQAWCALNASGLIDVFDSWGQGPGGTNILSGLGYYTDLVGHPSLVGLADIGRFVGLGILGS